MIFSFPPFDLGGLAWVALVPWLFALEKVGSRRAFSLSYLVGVLFFAGTIWWVGYVTVVGTVLLVAYLALYFAIWGGLAHRVMGTGYFFYSGRGILEKVACPLFLSSSWALLEWLRNSLFTGFGWNLLAHTQWKWTPIIQMADLTGAYGVSFLVVWVNLCLFGCYRRWRGGTRTQALVPLLFCLLGAGLFLLYGVVRLNHLGRGQEASTFMFRVAAVQGNIPQRLKWDEAFAQAVWKRYESLSQEAAEGKPQLILWPETATPGFFQELEVSDRLKAVAQAYGTFFLVGVPTSTWDRQFNSAVLLTPEGHISERYDKVHLVPFGEFVPLKPILGWLGNVVPIGEFSPGHRFTVFHISPNPEPRTPNPIAPFSVLICFEDLFPGLSRRFVQEGARWLAVITNDAWFHRSAASLQHLQASVFRAVENRVWVARAANTGFTGFIDPAGRIVAQAPRFQPAVATTLLILPSSDLSRSFYTRRGDLFLILCCIMAFLGALRAWIGWSNKGLRS